MTDPGPWRRWGPYLAERAWGTVREDYSADGEAWEHFPHAHARSRAYRWSEDGLAGWSDERQLLCLAFAFHNQVDEILKERVFGLNGREGNHGEDAKELWWFTDATPSHSWLSWRYAYPQCAFPYAELVAGNAARGREESEYELLDTGVLDGGHWDIRVDHAKAGPDDVCVRLTARNAGPDEATLTVLPTLWFRNTWSWGSDDRRPRIVAEGTMLVAEHHELGRLVLAGDGEPVALACDNDTNTRLLYDAPDGPASPKDGIGDHVLHGAPTVNPGGVGTKGALRYDLTVAPGATAEVRLRLAPQRGDLARGWGRTVAAREAEADAYHAALLPPGTTPEDALIARQALAGMIWSKQFFHYDVERWLDGDPAGPTPPAERRAGRNVEWTHLNNADIVSMPDTWEYPWYATWDLAFHCVTLAHVDPAFAKEQLLLFCREWYQHPDGRLPAYEWALGDTNPPVHAWAALRVFEIDGARDHEFLARVLHKLLLNFTWWVNRKDPTGSGVFDGGFLGLDNIGPLDRSAMLPVAGRLEQSDGTAWMAAYCLNLLEMTLLLAVHDRAYEDLATKFLEHFAVVATAIHERGLWHEEDGFYYDVLELEGGRRVPLRVRSMVGVVPLFAVTTLGEETLARLPHFASRYRWFLSNRPRYAGVIGRTHVRDGHEGRLLSLVGPERLTRVLATLLDPAELLSDHGLRSLSRRHAAEPFRLDVAGLQATVDYEPAESTTALFGGNSNWRGPVWFPLNHLVVEALRRLDRFFGDDLMVELPTGSGTRCTLRGVADDLSDRLVSLFRVGPDGRRPSAADLPQEWRDRLVFSEYFHGETGAGLGASHQTGWTGLVADLLLRRESTR